VSVPTGAADYLALGDSTAEFPSTQSLKPRWESWARVSHTVHIEDSRLYARIIRGGPIRQGDPVELIKEAVIG